MFRPPHPPFQISCLARPLAHTTHLSHQRAEPLALISFEAMKSHLQSINAAWSWPGPACLLVEKSLESNHREVSPRTPADKKQLCFKRKIKIISMPHSSPRPCPPEGLSSTGPPLAPNGDSRARLPGGVSIGGRIPPLSPLGLTGSHFASLAQSSPGK